MTNNYDSFTQKLQHAAVAVGATSGDQTLVAAPGASRYLWLVGYNLVAKSAVDVQWKAGAGSTAVSHSGTMNMTDFGQIHEPVSPYPVAQLAANKGLVLNLSTAKLVQGYVTYRVVGSEIV